MNGTLEINESIPAKLIVGDTELDVEIVSRSYKTYEHSSVSGIMCIITETTFTCVKKEYKRCQLY